MICERSALRFESLGLALLLAAAGPVSGQDPPPVEEREALQLLGDVRIRLESDWDSLRADGTERDDRDRMRGRFRFGFTYALDDVIGFGARIRSGSRESQQSSNATFGDDFEPKQVNLDMLYAGFRTRSTWGWAGKNGFPFWKHNELFWDNDVTPEGVALGHRMSLGGSGSLAGNFGYFFLGDSLESSRFSEKARLAALQLVAPTPIGRYEIVPSVGYFDFRNGPDQPSPALRGVDYKIFVVTLRVSIPVLPKLLALGFDLIKNVESYPESLQNGDQRTGWVAQAFYGGLGRKHEYQVGYTYAHIEDYAVVAFFAQDDWHRWGSDGRTRSSNFAGHELRVGFAFHERFNVVARYYDVTGIALRSPEATVKETGKRLRVDVNLGF